MHSVTVMATASMASQHQYSQPTSPILPQQNTHSLLTSLVSSSPTTLQQQQSGQYVPNQQFSQASQQQQTQFTPPDSNPSTPKQSNSTTANPNAPSSSSNSNSPSSPRGSIFNLPAHLQSQAKQLRTPRSPMYVPAVLRPTEKPFRSSPPKSRSKHSLDGPLVERRDSADGRSIVETEGSNILIESGETITSPRVQLKRMVTEEWRWTNLRDGNVIDGPPSRNHWKPDSATTTCDMQPCSRPFSLFVRRHHCRRCGGIFCAEHSAYFVPLDQHARFHPSALGRYRACEDCWKDYGVWETERVKRANETVIEGQESQDGSGRASLDIPTPKKKSVMGVIAQSVPRDWNWSTF